MGNLPRWYWWTVLVAALVATVVAVSMYRTSGVHQYESYIGIAAALINFCGFLLIAEQLGASKDATENQTRWEIEQVSFNVYKMLMETKTLHPYFYKGEPLPSTDHHDRHAVEAACELMLDYFEAIICSLNVLDQSSEDVWIKYMQKLYKRCPALSEFFKEESGRYTDKLFEYLEGKNSNSRQERMPSGLAPSR